MALLSCFTTNSPEMRRCLDPLPILTRPADNPRCRVDADCTGDNTICIRTDPAAHLVRLAYKSVWNVEGPVEQIVLWHGPRQEIYEQGTFQHTITRSLLITAVVEVGSHLPRIPFFPLWFPQLVYSFFMFAYLPAHASHETDCSIVIWKQSPYRSLLSIYFHCPTSMEPSY